MPRGVPNSGPTVELTPLQIAEKAFDKASRELAKPAKEMASAIAEYRSNGVGEDNFPNLFVADIQFYLRKLQQRVDNFDKAYKALTNAKG